MKTYLTQFETIGGAYAQKLQNKLKIRTVDDFLNHSIKEIHEKTEIDLDRLKEWLEVFDLYRIPNISPRQAELLRFANVNSVEELAHRQTIRIFYKLQEIDEKTFYIILQLPSFATIDNWIYYAKLMIKRMKTGANIPIILLPMVNFELASNLKKFDIFTVEDFSNKKRNISRLRKKINVKRGHYRELKQFIQLLQIDGIDLIIAKLFWKANLKSLEDITNFSSEMLLKSLNDVVNWETEKSCVPSAQQLTTIQKAIKNSLESDK